MNARRILFVPEEVILATWEALREGARAGCESTVRWAGPSHQLGVAAQVVSTVLVPAQRMGPWRFDVPHAATRAVGDALGRTGLVNLAQLHTHPRRWVGHSDWDDARAYSTRDGALSIVWPHYGRMLPEPCAWGVHECRSREWVELTAEDAVKRIVIVPSVIDLRVAVEFLGKEDGYDGDEASDDADDAGNIGDEGGGGARSRRCGEDT